MGQRLDALVSIPQLCLILEGGLKPTCIYELDSAKYSLVFIWSALVINEMEIQKMRPRFSAKMGYFGWSFGAFRKGT